MKYFYELAGIRVCADVPFEIHMQEESKAFSGVWDEKEDKADICLRLRPVDSLPEMSDHGHWAECHYYETGERDASVYYSTQFRGAPYACVRWSRDGARCECIYIRGKEYCLNYSRNIWDILGMETILLRNSGLLLHSSFIRCQGQAILFSAPCGTGKSTQAELWEKYEGADIINGDRAGLRNLDGVWKAFGLPYAGSSKIYRNESAPLGAIVLLRQAKDNHLRRLCPVEAFPDLYREVTVHRWDRQFVEKAIQIVEDNINNADFSVEELAAKLNISRGYLYKKIVKITGKTTLEFIRLIRMKRAQQLLAESQLQIAEIAYKLGYNSPKVFTKHFKEEFGMTPSEFIRQQTGGKQAKPEE